LSFLFKITFVSDQNSWNVIGGVLLDFAHPIFNSSEGLSVSDVVGNDDTVSSFIVTRSNGLESVLSCCVPL
jgi:hypothetical protein